MDSIDIFLIMAIIGAIGAIAFLIIFKKNKYLFRIRILTGSKKLIRDDIGTEWLSDKKVKYIKLKKMKEILPMPPSDSIDLNHKGKKVVECYRDERGNYAYIKDSGIEKFFQPINTSMQVLLADQVVKANSRNLGWKQHIPMIAGLGFITIIFLSFLLLIGEPLQALSGYTAGVSGNINEGLELRESILEKQIQLEQDIQIIKSAVGGDDIENPPN